MLDGVSMLNYLAGGLSGGKDQSSVPFHYNRTVSLTLDPTAFWESFLPFKEFSQNPLLYNSLPSL